MRGNEHKLHLAKFQLDIREKMQKMHKEDKKRKEQAAQRDCG